MFERLTRFWTPEIHFWRMRNYINGYSVIRSGKGDECYGMWENRSCVWKKFWTRKRLTKISPDSMHLPYANTPLHRELLAAYSFKYWAKQLSPLKRPLIHQDKSNWIVQNIFDNQTSRNHQNKENIWSNAQSSEKSRNIF